ncbi:hypothetical protein BKA63DRAFT_488898 [Paraphoma chrysanthemicola]|nr:hypothetical protein BKA63DRAFT_488898 [Paraphoma chrysanthemicola]
MSACRPCLHFSSSSPFPKQEVATSQSVTSFHYISAPQQPRVLRYNPAQILSRVQNLQPGGQGRRAPAMSDTSSGNWPRGPKEKSTNGNNSSHHHIRVIPRADEADQRLHSDSDTPTPTFCSLSLLSSVPRQSVMSSNPNHSSESVVRGKTFADMARRCCVQDSEVDNERLSHHPTSVAGCIKLQSNHKRSYGQWLPGDGAVSQLPTHEDEDAYAANSRVSAEHKVDSNPTSLESIGAILEQASHRGSHNKRPDSTGGLEQQLAAPHKAVNMIGVETNTTSPHDQASNRFFTKTPGSTGVGDQQAEHFGKLPDPIRLHEQLGAFDGQVIFIGHPNRDVSAHQWSAAAFQWENIGHYAHCRSRIEGLLASDILHRHEKPSDSLLLFKILAQNQEKIVVQGRRSGSDTPAQPKPKHMDIAPHATPRENMRDSLEETTIDVMYGERSRQTYVKVLGPTNVKIRADHVDDPFLTEVDSRAFQSAACSLSAKGAAEFTGSLDFGYEFPSRSTISTLENPGDPTRRDLDMAHMLQDTSSPSERLPSRSQREFIPDEDTSIHAASSDTSRVSSRQLPGFIPPANLESRVKLRNAARLCSPTLKRPTITQAHDMQPTARSLYPPTGLTVANPHRNVHQMQAGGDKVSGTKYTSDTHRPERSVVKYNVLAELQSSDPNGVLQSPCPDIANGLSHQSPTVQNFKGPFFTATKPTSHDPTASLADIDEGDKLRHWFRDSHRPARQREYAKSLASAAATAGKREMSSVGADAAAVNRDGNADITTPFVRLYETLSEYVDELHNGGGSYFSRSWKPASAYLRDPGPDGNNSYFSDEPVASSKPSPHATHYLNYQQGYGGGITGVRNWHNSMPYRRSHDVPRGHSTVYGRDFLKTAKGFLTSSDMNPVSGTVMHMLLHVIGSTKGDFSTNKITSRSKERDLAKSA